MTFRRADPGTDFESPAIRRVRLAAESLCGALERRMGQLLHLVEEETRLVREGKLFALRALEPQKSSAAREFINGMEAVKKIRPALEQHAPEMIQRLRRLHGEFRAMLQLNLAALEAAREASQDMVDGLAAGHSLRHAKDQDAA